MPTDVNPVDPAFDGHLERPLADLTFDERIDWIWECMQLLWIGQDNREAAALARNTGSTPD